MTISRVRQSPGGTDIYGDPVPSTETVTEIGRVGWLPFVVPRSSSDINAAGRAGVIIGLTLYLPYGFDIRHDDLVDVDGTRYRIDGEPGHWKHPSTEWEACAEVSLVRAEG